MLPRVSLQRGLVFALVIIALSYQFLTTTVLREYFEGDEGFYGTVALNMQESPYYWLHPTQVPEGTFETERARLGHPCVHCMVMAIVSRQFGGGIVPFQIVALGSFALSLYFMFRLIRLWDDRAGYCALLLAVVSPVILSEFRLLQAEPMMAAAGMAGLYFAVAGLVKSRMWLGALAGFCLGMAFLFKLWLSFPYPFAAGVAVLILAYLQKQSWDWTVRYLLLMLASFLVASSLHLLAVAIWTPQDLEFWLKEIYFSLFIGEGVQGAKLYGDSSDLPSNWAHPFWYYFAITYRNHFFLFPIIGLGLPYLFKRVYPAFSWIAPGIGSIVLLSVFAIKSSLYVLSATLFIYALAGFCLSALLFQTERAPLPRSIWNMFLVGFIVAAMVAVVLASGKISVGYKMAHTMVMALFLGLIYTSMSIHHRWTESVFLTGMLVLFGVFIVGDLVRRSPTDQIVSEIIAPYAREHKPNQVAFISPNFKSLQLYLFQRGRYWKDTPFNKDPEAFFDEMQQQGIRVFITGPAEWENPTLAPLMDYLSCHAKEITDQFRQRSGYPLDRRIFVLQQNTLK